MNHLGRITASVLLTLTAAASHATVVYAQSGGLASPTAVMTFDGSTLGVNATVTTEFTGAAFSGTSGSPRFSPCEINAPGWGSTYLVDNSYIGTYGPGCSHNGSQDDLNISFDSTVTDVSFNFISSIFAPAMMMHVRNNG